MSNSDSDIKATNYDFGSVLSESRKSQNYTVDDISRQLKIPEPVIIAIEACDITALPPPTFTKGYIRAYAKFLEISEEKVLDLYNHAVPHSHVTKLKSRSKLPNEKNSQSPLIKAVTVLLVVSGIAAVIFGGFEYYQEKASVLESEIEAKEDHFSGNSLDSPTIEPIEIEQNARLTEDDELVLQPSAVNEAVVEEYREMTDSAVSGAAGPSTVEPEPAGVSDQAVSQQTVPQPGTSTGGTDVNQDTIEIFAENGSWMEVRDANDNRLFYNLLPEGGTRKFRGTAPFYVSMGNARTTRVVINGLEVDASAYIRSNNTARFTVSSDQQHVIFH